MRAVSRSSSGVPSSAYPLLAPDGTAGAPSYSYTTDPTTGAYLPAAGQLGFSASGVLKASVWGTAGRGLSITAGTAASTVHGFSITQATAAGGEGANALNILPTWNSNASASTAILLNVTNTSSHASSLLMDLQVGGVSAFKIGKAGTTTFTGNVVMGASTGVTNAVSTTGTQFNVYGQYVSVGSAGIYGFTASTQDAALDAGVSRVAAGVIGFGTGAAGSLAGQGYGATLRTGQTTVASLPSASTSGAGAMAFVTDANATFIIGLGLAAVGGGSNKVPVYSDGTNWIVG